MGYLKLLVLLIAAPFIIRAIIYYLCYAVWALGIGPLPIKLNLFGVRSKTANGTEQPKKKRTGFGFLNDEEITVLSAEGKRKQGDSSL